MNFPKISVIVPVYNAERYLQQCISSIIAQTFTNFELLLIDDGSSDESGNICEKYAANDSRIRVFHVKNGGASLARNLGLDVAVGEFVTFIDADDWVTSSYLQELIKDVDEQNVFILHPPVRVFENNNTKAEIEELNCSTIEDKRFFIECGFLLFSEPHSKLFSLSVIKRYDIRFPEGVVVGEDGIFIARYLFYVMNIKTRNTPIYYYRDSETSVQKKIYDSASEWKAYQLWKLELEKLCYQVRINFASESIWYILSFLLNRYMNSVAYDNKKSVLEKYACLREIPLDDKRNYGKGMTGRFSRILKFAVNNDLNSLLLILFMFRNVVYGSITKRLF